MADVLALSRAEQENAKAFLRWRLLGHACTLIVSAVALFVEDPLTYVLALVAVVTEAAAWGLRRHALTLHERAERGRRKGVLDEAFGPADDGLETARLKSEFSAQAQRREARWDDPEYWSTQGTPHEKGPALFRANLQESAFWSEQLYRAAGWRSVGRLVVALLVLAFIAVTFLALGEGEGGQTFTRVAAVVLAVLVSTDELGVTLDYFHAGRVARETVNRLARSDMSDTRDALATFVSYSVATATAPPIPTRVYERKHDHIQQMWRDASHRRVA